MGNSQETEKSKYIIICKVDKIIFHDDKSGRTIMSAVKDDGKSCRVLGSMNDRLIY